MIDYLGDSIDNPSVAQSMSSDYSDEVAVMKISEVDASYSCCRPSLVNDEAPAEERIVDCRSVSDLMGELIDGGLRAHTD
jgi:hypothetical protein